MSYMPFELAVATISRPPANPTVVKIALHRVADSVEWGGPYAKPGTRCLLRARRAGLVTDERLAERLARLGIFRSRRMPGRRRGKK